MSLSSSDRLPRAWLHPDDFAAARAAQLALLPRVVRADAHGPVRLIGGCDISCRRFDPERRVFAAIVVLALPRLRPVASATAMARAPLPYLPGFLGFREVPALLAAWDALPVKPDLLLMDGQGIAHPRGFGVATHLGVALDVPCVGVAKSRLVGEADVPGAEAGAETPLLLRGERVGSLLRSRARANPLYVSTGHRVAPASAALWVRRTLAGYRLPEPTRLAHLAANAARRAWDAATEAAPG